MKRREEKRREEKRSEVSQLIIRKVPRSLFHMSSDSYCSKEDGPLPLKVGKRKKSGLVNHRATKN